MSNPLSHLLESELERLLENVREHPAIYTVKESDVEQEIHRRRRNPVLPPDGWTPIAKRMPEERVPVLCWRRLEDAKGDTEANTFVAFRTTFRTTYRKTQHRWFLTADTLDSDGSDAELFGPDPTHWLPIPGNLPVFDRSRLVRWMREKVVWCRETVAKGEVPVPQASLAKDIAAEIEKELDLICAEMSTLVRLV